jgi:hypothetical protein
MMPEAMTTGTMMPEAMTTVTSHGPGDHDAGGDEESISRYPLEQVRVSSRPSQLTQ